MADRRRLNGPSTGSSRPIFLALSEDAQKVRQRSRVRKLDQPRKIFLQTDLTASASGSAYFEVEPSSVDQHSSLYRRPSSLKLSCTVHGPKPLPRNAAFSPQLLVSTHIKYAPFAAKQRKGFLRDSSERDLGAHLETALKGVILGDRWPKSGVDINITLLESEDECHYRGHTGDHSISWGHMSILAGCITAASAALVEAGVDCLDLVTGGVAALVSDDSNEGAEIAVDPSPTEHRHILASCCVAYLASRDEVTELWIGGDLGADVDGKLLDQAVSAALGARGVVAGVLREGVESLRAARTETIGAKHLLKNRG